MIVIFRNETSSPIILELGENIIEIKSGMQITADSDTARMQFNCYLNYDSQFKTMKFPSFVVLHYNFIVNSFYDVILKRDKTVIKFTEKEAKGDHSEKYRFLDINGDYFEILNKEFKVRDEEKSKLQLSEYRRRDEKATNVLRVFDVLQTICYVGVPGGILFFGTWYFANLLTALYVTVPTAIVGVLVGLLIRNLLKKVNNKLEKLGEYENDLYVDDDSYFQKEYILNVINVVSKQNYC